MRREHTPEEEVGVLKGERRFIKNISNGKGLNARRSFGPGKKPKEKKGNQQAPRIRE